MEMYEKAGQKEHNFFDIEHEFFLIDSEHLDEVETRFYGFSVQRSGIYEESNLTEEAIEGLDGRGCYVYVEAKDGHISIRQDFCGCYGIYLFRAGEYFALSNSFLRLLQHVSQKYPLTVNKDYGHHILTESLSSESPFMTPVEEIVIVDRWARLTIDRSSRKLSEDRMEYKELSYSLDTPEGIAILDDWYDFWTEFIRNLSKQTDFIKVDLSGGFDSRMAFLLVLCSGLDLNRIQVHTLLDKEHTHAEDYEIASAIAKHYGFALNRPLPQTQWLNYSQADCVNIEAYTKLGFHKEPRIYGHISHDKIYRITGLDGESVREVYTVDAEEYIRQVAPQEYRFTTKLSREIFDSVSKVITSGYDIVDKKYGKQGDSREYPQLLYREGWTRSHYGKLPVGGYFAGGIDLTPLLDPMLWKLKLHTEECRSNNLLMAFIYARYCPKLLEFPFEGRKYSISAETAEFAKKLNERYPRKNKVPQSNDFVIDTKNTIAAHLFQASWNNNFHDAQEINAILKKTFDSSEVKGLFTACFDEQLYEDAERYYHWSKYFPIRNCTAVLGMTNAIKYVLFSRMRMAKDHPALSGCLPSCNYKTGNRWKKIERFKFFITARLDFKLYSSGPEDMDIIAIDDDMAEWNKPDWLQTSGGGIMLHSSEGSLSLTLKVKKAGDLHIWLRGTDVREPGNQEKRIPYWIDFKKLVIKGKEIFSGQYSVWHDQPFEYRLNVEAGEEISIATEWMPHRQEMEV